MAENKIKIGLFILALFIVGIVSYRFGSDNATKRYIEYSKVAVPVTVETAIRVYEDCGCQPSGSWCGSQLVKASWLRDYFDMMNFLDGGESPEDAEFYLPP